MLLRRILGCRSQNGIFRRGLALALSLLAVPAALAQKPSYVVLHSFGGTVAGASGAQVPDGRTPFRLVVDSSGTTYGTCNIGGAYNLGTLWEVTPKGVYYDLHDFGGTVKSASGITVPDAQTPAVLTFDKSGNVFGVAPGGAYSKGMIWEYTASGKYLDYHDIGATTAEASVSGAQTGSIAIDPKGNIFGCDQSDGPTGKGLIWELSATGIFTDLHDFGGQTTNANGEPGNDGQYGTGICMDPNGNLFGTAQLGGLNGFGMIWELTSGGKYLDLHDFAGMISGPNGTFLDGGYPDWPSITTTGDVVGRCVAFSQSYPETAWRFSHGGAFTELHQFGGSGIDSFGNPDMDGGGPGIGVAFDASQDVFGGSAGGGTYGAGILWEVDKTTGDYFDIHDFGSKAVDLEGNTVPDGTSGFSVAVDGAGNLYGTTGGGGVYGHGTLVRLSPAYSVDALSLSSSVVVSEGSDQGTVTLNIVAPLNGETVSLTSSSPLVAVPATVTVPSGAASATFTATAGAISTTTQVTITAKLGSTSQTVNLTLEPSSLTSIVVNPDSFPGGVTRPVFGKVTFNGPAPSSGETVTLTSSNPRILKLPPSIKLAAGATTLSFPIVHYGVNSKRVVTLAATFGTQTVSVQVNVLP